MRGSEAALPIAAPPLRPANAEAAGSPAAAVFSPGWSCCLQTSRDGGLLSGSKMARCLQSCSSCGRSWFAARSPPSRASVEPPPGDLQDVKALLGVRSLSPPSGVWWSPRLQVRAVLLLCGSLMLFISVLCQYDD